ncbi:MAG: RusA family crossover junction endodeoxyribonuclease [bacterium]
MIEITIPYPPSVNHFYRRVGPRTLISREGRTFCSHVAYAHAIAGAPHVDGPLALDIELYPPDNRRRDADNTIKPIQDALQKAGMFKDDSQIKRVSAEMMGVEPGGFAVLRVRPYTRR